MIVVTDTSVVLNLCWLRRESLLSHIYEQVLAPPEVRSEFERKAATDRRFIGMRFPHFVTVERATVIPKTLSQNRIWIQVKLQPWLWLLSVVSATLLSMRKQHAPLQ